VLNIISIGFFKEKHGFLRFTIDYTLKNEPNSIKMWGIRKIKSDKPFNSNKSSFQTTKFKIMFSLYRKTMNSSSLQECSGGG
jgi:hypothetical protein